MDMGLSDTESLSNNSKTYRQGIQGANGGKNGGGCGCNQANTSLAIIKDS